MQNANQTFIAIVNAPTCQLTGEPNIFHGMIVEVIKVSEASMLYDTECRCVPVEAEAVFTARTGLTYEDLLDCRELHPTMAPSTTVYPAISPVLDFDAEDLVRIN
jgi:hypothetical protein